MSTARFLIGKVLECQGRRGIIVETESYTDLASHARSETPRSALMRQTYGHVYVYQTYGMYYCLNITTDKHAPGAVLIRAVEPIEGIDAMRKLRGVDSVTNIADGPGKLCQAFGISKKFNGTHIGDILKVYEGEETSPNQIGSSPRIGISQDTELHWRFFLKNSPFISTKK